MENENHYVSASSETEQQENLRRELRKFNWGAALFGFFWCIANGCFLKWFISVVIFAAILGTLVFFVFNNYMPWAENQGSLRPIAWMVCFLFWEVVVVCPVLFIYTGIRGNSWAWNSGKFRTLEAFRKEQHLWAVIAFIVFFIQIILPIIYTVLGGVISFNRLNITSDRIQKNACRTMNSALPDVFGKMKNGFDIDIFTVQLMRNPNITEVYNYTYFDNKKLYQVTADAYNSADTGHAVGKSRVVMNIQTDTECSFKNANCYIDITTYSTEKAPCRFYFNQKGKLSPSKKTMEILDIIKLKKQEK